MRTLDASVKTDPDNNYYMGEIGVLHDVIHQGKMHAMSYTELDVADGSSLFVLMVAGEDKDIHLRLNYGGEFKTRLKSYVNTIYTDASGTEYIPFNRQTALPNTLESKFYINPTISNNGDQRGNEFIGTGGSPVQRVGGDSTNDLETIVNAGTVLLIEIMNDGGSVSDLEFSAAVYERSKFAIE